MSGIEGCDGWGRGDRKEPRITSNMCSHSGLVRRTLSCMAPPRDLDTAAAAGPGGLPPVDEYEQLCEDIAQTQGVINLAGARMVELTRRGLDMGVSGGDNLPPREW